jgi:ABC-type multidrug transport system fused ATPase/permease subunit
LDEVSAGTVTNTITTSANTIQMSISDKLHSLFMALALTIAAFSIAFRYSWAMTLVTGSSLLFVLLVYSISTPITLKKLQAVEKANQRAASIAGEIFGSIRAVFSLGAEPALTKKYVSSVDDVHKHGLGLSLQLGIQLSPIWFAMYSAFALAFWFGLKLFREGHIGSISTVIMSVIHSVFLHPSR